LQARLDSLGTDTQQKMIFVEDLHGAIQFLPDRANSGIRQSNSTLAEIAKTR
jgi:hypothetical protein